MVPVKVERKCIVCWVGRGKRKNSTKIPSGEMRGKCNIPIVSEGRYKNAARYPLNEKKKKGN